MGSVYQPKLKSGGRSARWVIAYYVPGKGKVHENAGSEDRRAAARLLKERDGKLAAGEPLLPRATKVRYDERSPISGCITRPTRTRATSARWTTARPT
jgi:hypothetical protein